MGSTGTASRTVNDGSDGISRTGQGAIYEFVERGAHSASVAPFAPDATVRRVLPLIPSTTLRLPDNAPLHTGRGRLLRRDVAPVHVLRCLWAFGSSPFG